MDAVMLDTLRRACAARDYIAVDFDAPGVEAAVLALAYRGWITVDMARRVCATAAGRNALAEHRYHVKHARKQRARDKSRAKQNCRHDFAVAIVGAAVGIVGTILVQIIFRQ